MLHRSVVSNFLQYQGLQPARLLCPCRFSRHEYWSGLPCPPPGDLPNPVFEPRFPALQVDFLLSEPSEKPRNTGLGSLSLLQGIFHTQELDKSESTALLADSYSVTTIKPTKTGIMKKQII